jgi:hypothetical protein
VVIRCLVVAIVIAIGSAFGACTILDDDPPTNTCKGDNDCFRVQGERCNVQKHVCELAADAGVDAP